MSGFNQEQDKISIFQEAAKDEAKNKYQSNSIFSKIKKVLASKTGRDDSSTSIPESILQILDSIWNTNIIPILISEFGSGSFLYCIFYLGDNPEEVIMEIWDSKYTNIKPSQVFKLKGMFDETVLKQLSKERSKAKPFILEDWSE